MKRILRTALCFAALLALTVPAAAWAETAQNGEIETIVTLVTAPPQTQAERPPCFPDPADNYIPLPETENLAQGKPVLSGAHTDVYVDKNVNDGKTDTYWESKGFPAEIIFDLQGTFSISTVAVCLNPSSIWEPRIQEIAVQVSLDGESYAEAAAPEKYQFDPATGNRVRIDFNTVQAAYVKLVFTLNTSSRTGGAQAAEICVFE